MELDELHVHERDTGAIRNRHSVTGGRVAVCRLGVHATQGRRWRKSSPSPLTSSSSHPSAYCKPRRPCRYRLQHTARWQKTLRRPSRRNVRVAPRACAGSPGPLRRRSNTSAANRRRQRAVVRCDRQAGVRKCSRDVRARRFGLVRIRRHCFDRVLIPEIVGALDAVERVVLRGIVLAITERGVDAALRGAEWLRTGCIFETIATSAPPSAASTAARIPASPPPTTTTSCLIKRNAPQRS